MAQAASAHEPRPKSFKPGDIVRRRGSIQELTVEDVTTPKHHWANPPKLLINGRWERQIAFIWLAPQQPYERAQRDEQNENAESVGCPCGQP